MNPQKPTLGNDDSRLRQNVKNFARRLAVVLGVAALGLLPAPPALAGINVNETDNSVLCKGASCKWLKQACKQERGTYSEGAGGTSGHQPLVKHSSADSHNILPS